MKMRLRKTLDGFVQAARRCHKSGFDGVEVWAAYHGMVDQFWTPWSNRRGDRGEVHWETVHVSQEK
ncbi:MAG: hypothetical protein Ct9H300mP28_36590 [Pseudomonadota bacterium]|nr:MAG: hypothetical protein Ct9H300mP28_36590 [Pseudomonadota bacterium]